MRLVLLLLIVLLCRMFPVAADVTERKLNFVVDSTAVYGFSLEEPAWSGQTRLVCSKSMVPWTLKLFTSASDSVSVDVAWKNSVENFEPEPVLCLSVASGGDTVKSVYRDSRGAEISRDDYMVTVSWSVQQGVSVAVVGKSVGNNLSLSSPVVSGKIEGNGKPVSFTEWSTRVRTVTSLIADFDAEEIALLCEHTTDSVVGIYGYVDRDTDSSKAMMGGEYLLAILPVENSGDYAVCYLQGAAVNRNMWHPGMVKGILQPTEFHNHFNLRWLDAEFHEMKGEQYAVFQGNNLIEFNFPLHKSKFRMVKRASLNRELPY